MLRGVTGALRRGVGATGPASAARQLPRRGLEEFIDTVTPKGEEPSAGRAWQVVELRQKSFEDLHKLWWVAYKEKNMLLTERQEARRKGLIDIRAPDRAKKVNATLKAIRHVVDEREKNRKRIKEEAEAEVAREKFLAVRAKALAEGRAPKNAPDVRAAAKARAKAEAEAAAAAAGGVSHAGANTAHS